MLKLSLAISASGWPEDFFAAGAFFCFLLDGGVLFAESSESSSSESAASTSEFSSSESGFARFLGLGALFVTLSVVCLVAFGLDVAGFFAGAFAGAFAFY